MSATGQPGSRRHADPDQLGRELVTAFYAATKLVSLYGNESQVSMDAVTGLLNTLDPINALYGYT